VSTNLACDHSSPSTTPQVQLEPHPLGYNKQNSTSHQRLAASRPAKQTHLDLLPELTNKQRRPLSCTSALFSCVPRVARTDRQTGAISRKRQCSDRGVVARVLPKPLFDLVVPDRNSGIRATGCERIVRRVESQRIDRPDVVNVVNCLAMTLERVLFFLDGRRWIKVFYGDSALDRRGCVPWQSNCTS
jgi:hypothetical protein